MFRARHFRFLLNPFDRCFWRRKIWANIKSSGFFCFKFFSSKFHLAKQLINSGHLHQVPSLNFTQKSSKLIIISFEKIVQTKYWFSNSSKIINKKHTFLIFPQKFHSFIKRSKFQNNNFPNKIYLWKSENSIRKLLIGNINLILRKSENPLSRPFRMIRLK